MLRSRKQSVLVSKQFKEKKRKKQTWKIIAGVFLAVGVVAGVVGSFHIPQLQVSGVTVDVASSESHISPIITSEIEQKIHELIMNRMSKARLYLFPGSHLMFNLPSTIAKELEGIDPRVVSVDVRKINYTELRIKPEIRIPYGLWCSEAWCVSIDTTGVVIGSDIEVAPVQKAVVSDLSFKDQSAFVFYKEESGEQKPEPGSVYMDADVFNASTQFAERLRQEGFVVNTFTVHTYGEDQIPSASLQNDEGQQLFMLLSADEEDYANTLKYFRLFKAQIQKERVSFDAFEYVDLRFGNAVYFKKTDEELLDTTE